VRPRDGERGTSAIEFALVLPLLLLLLLALVQVGVLAHDQLVLTQASRAGAREAAVGPSAGAVDEAVRNAAVGLDGERLRVEIVRAGARGSPVTVSLTYEAPIATTLAGWLFPDSVTLRGSATMRQEFA
jgi:Flp pilus assembly protein TadG